MVFENVFREVMDKVLERIDTLRDVERVGGDLPIQFPSATQHVEIPAGGVIEEVKTVNRLLKYLHYEVPAGVLVEIYLDNMLLLWFEGETGDVSFDKGVYGNEVRVVARNENESAARYKLKSNWSIA